MKKILTSIIALAAFTLTTNAQIMKIYKGDVLVHQYKATEADKVVIEEEPTDAHEYVDLGLPSGTLWATCNVGAEKPEDYGQYFAWGETEPQESNRYYWNSYKWSNGGTSYSDPRLTKYCNNSSYGNDGFTDTKTILDSEDDAATVNWGANWCMPTDEQWIELRTNCTWTWTTENDVYGRKVTGTNGKSIFLPAAGCRGNGSLGNVGSWGYYWSRSLYTSYPSLAWYVYFYSGDVGRDYNGRFYGFSVRPVRSE